jgi:hypothetical protein
VSRLSVGLTAFAFILLPSYQVTAGSRSEEHENEAVVYRGASACGVERWAVKTGMDADARSINQKAVHQTTIFHLRSLPAPRFLPARSRIKPVEATVWQVTGTLVRVKEEQDSDFHLVIADSGGRTMITEVPAPACIGSSPFLPSEKYVRRTFTADFHPSSSWQRPNVKVTVRGVGFFDYLHGQSGVAPNGIELHPLLGFSLGGSSSSGAPPPPPLPKPAPRPSTGGSLSVRAYVVPSTMSYNAYPTLYAKTKPGASCSATVVYSTGRSPVSFDGSARSVGSSGTVSWSWHEETSGSGGTARVMCSFRRQTKTATASFSVG